MKTYIRVLIFISISLFALNCNNDEMTPVQGKVQFVVSVSSKPSDGGRILSTSLPDGAYISVSIETTAGASVYSLQKVDLMKLGDGYVTAPLNLVEGNYRLTDFLVLSATDEVLYVTPKEGSDLASLVTDPLPINFSITKDGIVNLNVQVVNVAQQSPENFGYVSFGIEVVKSDFAISVFISDNTNLSLTSGTLHLYQGTDLVYTQALLPKVNPVNFTGDPNATYTLVIVKEGYTLKSKQYVLRTLVEELNGSPLTIMLEPASTLTLLVKDSTKLELRIGSTNNDVFIDWGDGMVERAIIPPGDYRGTLHKYTVPGRYFVNITGDLNSITGFSFLWFQFEIEKSQRIETVDITQLSELRQYSLTWHKDTPEEIDFSHNTKLEHLDVQFSNITRLDLSHNIHMKLLYVVFTPLTSNNNPDNLAEMVDLIHTVNLHAITNNIREGVFAFEPLKVNALPNDSRIKLISLKEDYGWQLYPSPN